MIRPRLGLSVLLVACGALAHGSQALAGSNPGLAIFGDVHVGKDEVRHDDVVCIGGHATIEGKVEGDVVVIGGKLEFSGEARQVVSVFSRSDFKAGALVHDDLVQVLGPLTRDPEARFEGQVTDVGSRLPPRVQRLLAHGLVGLFVLLRIIGLVVSAIVVMLIALLIPERIERMAGELDERWPASIGYGLLGCVLLIIVVVGLAITIIGIPFALLLGLLAKLLGLAGITAILLTLGKRIGAEIGFLGEDSSVLAVPRGGS